MSLLNGPIPDILQNPSHGASRATTCDCIANIGDEMFSTLPVSMLGFALFEYIWISTRDYKNPS